MKGRKQWFWTIARIILAVGLLVFVFTSVVTVTDTVYLADGSEISGRIRQWDSEGVTLEIDGASRFIEISEVELDKAGKSRIERGLISILREMTPGIYVAGAALIGVIPAIASLRWLILLAAHGIHIGFWRALELTFIGLFFNNVSLGLTGGDVVKAYYATKLTSTKKTTAVVTVFLDRVVGLVLLAVVAGVAVILGSFSALAEKSDRFSQASWIVWAFIAACAVGAVGFYSRRLRRAAGTFLKGIPGYNRLRSSTIGARVTALLKRVDEALFFYRYRKKALFYAALISAAAHCCAIVSIYLFGRALNITEASLLSYFVIIPVCFILSSVPITPAGWGVGEVLFGAFFGAVGVAPGAAVTMSVIYRLTQALWTLPGGVMLMFQRDRPTVEEVGAEMGNGRLEKANGTDGN
ncbi:MAG: lysylphosphatidylglycerol synthase transmembrane domain-containing protein [Planctomycetota bacterium]|jgi:uncharacterized protein (TIRG00374 family)